MTCNYTDYHIIERYHEKIYKNWFNGISVSKDNTANSFCWTGFSWIGFCLDFHQLYHKNIMRILLQPQSVETQHTFKKYS